MYYKDKKNLLLLVSETGKSFGNLLNVINTVETHASAHVYLCTHKHTVWEITPHHALAKSNLIIKSSAVMLSLLTNGCDAFGEHVYSVPVLPKLLLLLD